MNDQDKTREELAEEIVHLRRQVSELEHVKEALQKSESRFQSLFENMGNAVAVYKAEQGGEDFVLIDFNKATEKIEQISRDEVLGKNVLKVFPGVKESGLFHVFQRVWRTGQPEYHPVSECKDNRIQGWRENFVYRLCSEEIVSVYSDETERKKVEDELIESERRYRDLIEGAPVGIFQSTFDGRVISVNPAYARMYGYASAEEAALEIDNVAERIYVKPERRKMLTDAALSADGFVKAENQYRRKDGSLFWGQLYFRVVRGCDGKAKNLEGFVEDITERKQAQEDLRESEERYRAVFDNAGFGIDLVDGDGRFVQVNNALKNMLGYTERELYQLRFTDITHPDDRAISEQKVDSVLRREISTYRLEKRFVKKDGSTMWGDLSVSAIRDGNGEHIATLGVFADITDRKEAEEALKASHEALAAYSATLEAKVQERTSELEQSRADLKIYSESLEKANEALKLIIGGIEEQKKDVETRITQNLNLTVKPLLDQLKSQQLPDATAFLLQSIEFNLSNMFSSFRLKVGHLLTPKEMRICEMIRSGLSSRQIAKALNISPQTVLVHRKNVRKKLSLAKSRSNLASFLKANDGF